MPQLGKTTTGIDTDYGNPVNYIDVWGPFTSDATGGLLGSGWLRIAKPVATAAVRLVLYADNGSGTDPGAPIAATDEVTVTTALANPSVVQFPGWTKQAGGVAPTLAANTKYWLGIWYGTTASGQPYDLYGVFSGAPTRGVFGFISAYSLTAAKPTGTPSGFSAGYGFDGWFDYGSSVTTVTGAATLSGTGTLAAAGIRKRTGAAALTGAGALVATGTRERTGAVTLSGAGALTATGRRTVTATAVLAGAGTLTAAGTRIRVGQAALTGTGSLSATAGTVAHAVTGQATLTGTGSLLAAGTHAATGQITLAGLGGLSLSAFVSTTGAAALTGQGTLTVAHLFDLVMPPSNGGGLLTLTPRAATSFTLTPQTADEDEFVLTPLADPVG